MDAERNNRTTAIGLARYAKEYLEAAIVVNERMGKDMLDYRFSPVPAYFLLAHGIELTLKSYLRYSGLSVEELSGRDLGHNLSALRARSCELGLSELHHFSDEDTVAFDVLSAANEFHQLRYIQTGPKTFPDWAIAESMAVRLHQTIGPKVGYESLKTSYPTPAPTLRAQAEKELTDLGGIVSKIALASRRQQ